MSVMMRQKKLPSASKMPFLFFKKKKNPCLQGEAGRGTPPRLWRRPRPRQRPDAWPPPPSSSQATATTDVLRPSGRRPKSAFPTSNKSHLIDFFLSSDAEIFVNKHGPSMQVGAQTCKNVCATRMRSY